MCKSREWILASTAAMGLLLVIVQPIQAQDSDRRLPGEKARTDVKDRMTISASVHLVPVDRDGRLADGLLVSYRIPYASLSFRRAPDASRATADIDIVVQLLALKSSDLPKQRDIDRMEPILTHTENLFITEEDLDAAVKKSRSLEGAFIITLDDDAGGDADAKSPAFLLPVVEFLNPGRDPRRSQLPALKMDEKVRFIPVKPLQEDAAAGTARNAFTLSSAGQAVTYGEDIGLLMIIQDGDGGMVETDVADRADGVGFSVVASAGQAGVSGSDTLRQETLARTEAVALDGEGWRWFPSLGSVSVSSDSADNAVLVLSEADAGEPTGWSALFAVVPGARFPNAPLSVTLYELEGKPDGMKTDERRLLGQTSLASRWADMPASLLSLDKALDDMALLLGEQEVDRLSKAGRAKKLERFNSYWIPRDPTPDTHYNELMTEYFRRIDTANQRYSTPTTRGSSSDQGKTYIIQGEPLRIDREFPSGSPAVERWTYQGMVFVFEATTGFGDFKLKEKRAL